MILEYSDWVCSCIYLNHSTNQVHLHHLMTYTSGFQSVCLGALGTSMIN
jgi:hypothetical protein